MGFAKFALCDTNINHRVGRTSILLIPSLITTGDTVLIVITILVVIHVQNVVVVTSTIGLISHQLFITPGVWWVKGMPFSRGHLVITKTSRVFVRFCQGYLGYTRASRVFVLVGVINGYNFRGFLLLLKSRLPTSET